MTSEPDYYAVLQVRPTADEDVIQGAYEILVQKYGTGIGPDADERRRLLGEAFAVLSDPARRAEYDARSYAKALSGGPAKGGARPAAPPALAADSDYSIEEEHPTLDDFLPFWVSPFASWLFHTAVIIFWGVLAVKTGSWLFAIGGLIYLGIAVAVELPDSSSDATADDV